MTLNRTQYMVGAAFQAGVAYLLFKHKHPIWAYLFAAGAAWNVVQVARSSS